MAGFDDFLDTQSQYTSPSSMQSWSGEHSMGALPGEQGYGLSNLWRFYKGMSSIYEGSNAGDMEGTAWIEELRPDMYDMGKSGEADIRKMYEEARTGHTASIRSMQNTAIDDQYQEDMNIRKSGFAQGGTAAINKQSVLDSYSKQKSARDAQFSSQQDKFKSDIYQARRDYIDEQWEKHNTFASQLETGYSPGGGWDAWDSLYGSDKQSWQETTGQAIQCFETGGAWSYTSGTCTYP